MNSSFDSSLAALRSGSSLEREIIFQKLRSEVPEHEDELLEAVSDPKWEAADRTYLLALLADLGSEKSMPAFRVALEDPITANRAWARRGIARLMNVQEDEVEEPEPRDLLFSILPDKTRYLQLIVVQEAFVLGVAAMMLALLYLVTLSEAGVRAGFIVVVMMGIVRAAQAWWRGKEIDRLLTIKVAKDWIEGPSEGGRRRRWDKSQIKNCSVGTSRLTPRAFQIWNIEGPEDEGINIWETIYNPAEITMLRAWLSRQA